MRGRSWMGVVCCVLGVLPGTESVAGPESGDGVVRFKHQDEQASEIYVVGDWNGWSPTATPMDPLGDGTWIAEVFLDAGRYEYKLLVDGVWLADPGNPEVSESGNSVLRVGAKGTVLPPENVASEDGGASSSDSGALRWTMRYLGFVTSREDPGTGQYELVRPEHQIDVSLEANPTDDLDAWVLMKLNTLEDGTGADRFDLRFDRSQVRWHPGTWDLRLLDNTRGFDFDDPAVLLGRVGIYADPYGTQRRGVFLHKKIAGAPLQFVYTDNTEALSLQDSLRSKSVWEAAPYAARNVRRNADTVAFRFRGGRADAGLGVSLRHDRGAYPGQVAEFMRGSDSLGAVADVLLHETTESWNAWGVDLAMKLSEVRLRAEYLSGTRHARAQSTILASGIRPDSLTSDPQFAPVTVSGKRFDLSSSRRVVVHLDGGDGGEIAWQPALIYQYEEHHQGDLVTGRSFLMRRHGLALELSPAWSRLQMQLQLGQDWFTYPDAASWETQFWFRRHNPWLDEDVAGLQRFTLLGEEAAATAQLQLDALLWAAHDIRAQWRLRWAAPGWDAAPRYVENVLRFTVPLPGDLSLRTHSRLATYRRFDTQDADVVRILGPGPHVAAGSLARGDYADVSYDTTSYLEHFIEVVYEISSRSDIALGFGVDPWVLYRVRNEYMDIGWEQFVFSEGAGPDQAYGDPEHLGARLETAESRLQRERRLTLEARLRF